MSEIEWAVDLGHGENTWERGGGKGVLLSGDLGGGRMEEHWFNSAVGIYTKELLEHNGIKVFMAQKPYAPEVPLKTRTDMYNARKVRGVLSIHANAGVSKADGFCAFYWHNAGDSKNMANIWMKYAKAILGDDMEVFGQGAIASVPNTWTNFHICRETNMKAILTENGFMTNAKDIRDLLSDSFRRKVAEVNARMICEIEGISFKPLSAKTQPAKVIPAPNEKVGSVVVTATEKKIEKGDTIWEIAREMKIDVEDIMTLNPGLDPEKLQIGQVIKLKPSGKSKMHTIEKGDTLWAIAGRNKTTVKRILDLNPGIDPQELEVGSTVKLDGSKPIAPIPAPKSKPTPAPASVILRLGSKGSDVRALQNKLNSFGFNVGKADGIFGGQTESGLKQFQKAVGLLIDGIYGPNTAKALASYKKPVVSSFVGRRVESIYNEPVNFYSRASWDKKYKAGEIKKGWGFPYIIGKVKVDGSFMFRVKNSKGQIFYITAHSKYVTVK